MQTEPKEIMSLLSSDKSEDIREGAYQAGNLKLVDAVPLLMGHIESTNPGILEAVDTALRKIGGKPVLFAALPFLRSEDPPVRNMAMDLLRQVGSSDTAVLTELLFDDDPDIRIFGSDILGSTGSPLAVAALGNALLRDREVNVRYQAAVSLGDLAYPDAAESLNKALGDDEWVQFAVIEALIKVGAESSVEALIKAFDKSSDLVASIIVDAIAELGYIKAVPLLLKRLPDANVPMANKIVRAVIKIVGARSINFIGKDAYANMKPFMLQALQDEDTEIQDAAAQGLAAGSKDADAFKAVFELVLTLDPDRNQERMINLIKLLTGMGYQDELAKCMKGSDDFKKQVAIEIISGMDDQKATDLLAENFWEHSRDVQRAASNTLQENGGEQYKGLFEEILDKSKDGDLLKAAIAYFGKLKDPQIILERIFPLLQHPYDDVKEAALAACIRAKNPEINEKFRGMADSEDVFSRMMAMHALGRYDIDGNLSYLSKGLKDESADVRKVTVEAMQEHACPMGQDRIDILEPLLQDSDRDVRLAVLDVLGECAGEVITYLLKGLKDEDPWVRARCAENIGTRRLTKAAPELAELLHDENTLVVIKTVDALAQLGGEYAFQYLLPLVDHPDHDVQRAVEDTLDKIRKDS